MTAFLFHIYFCARCTFCCSHQVVTALWLWFYFILSNLCRARPVDGGVKPISVSYGGAPAVKNTLCREKTARIGTNNKIIGIRNTVYVPVGQTLNPTYNGGPSLMEPMVNINMFYHFY